MAIYKCISKTQETKGPHSWEYSHDEVWMCAEKPFTKEMVEDLIDKHVSFFPITGVTFTMNEEDPHKVTLHVIEDNCM